MQIDIKICHLCYYDLPPRHKAAARGPVQVSAVFPLCLACRVTQSVMTRSFYSLFACPCCGRINFSHRLLLLAVYKQYLHSGAEGLESTLIIHGSASATVAECFKGRASIWPCCGVQLAAREGVEWVMKRMGCKQGF
jgi:hypothetical protein